MASLTFGDKQPSRYIRTSWMLNAIAELTLPNHIKMRFLSQEEVQKLQDEIKKRNVFARHSWENNFYIQRVKDLSDKTVIEIFLPGEPVEISEQAEQIADLLEKIAVLSTVLAISKDSFQQSLGIRPKSREEINFIIGAEYRYLSSRSMPEPAVKGVLFDERSRNRFQKCGFPALFAYLLNSNHLANRVQTSLDWLFASRIDPVLTASVVKTSIALESLLIFSESESLARSLSERVAFILSPIPETRQNLSKIIKKFYNVRSGIVHGSRKKLKDLSPELLESVDRLCLLCYLVIASNSEHWKSVESLQNWCEAQRWGNPAQNIRIPYSKTYLQNAIKLGLK